MKTIAAVVALGLAGCSALASAQDRDGRRDGWRDHGTEGARDGRRDGTRDWSRDGTRDWNRDGTRDWNRDGTRDWNRDGRRDWSRDGRHWEGDRRHWSGGDRWHGHRHGYYSYPRYGYYASPRWLDYYYAPAPYYSYAPGYVVPFYEEPPVIVERIYEEAPPRVHREYRERSYAQVEPSRPAPPATPAPPRLERVTLSAQELFEFDKATLRQPQPKLDEIAAALVANPGIRNVTITGYTDQLGTDAYNLKLSQRRAEAVKSYLAGKGVEARRLTAVGKGEANPVVQCNDKDRAALIRCLEPNRRVEVEEITVNKPAR